MRGEQEKICFEQIKEWAINKIDRRLLSYWNTAVANSDDNAFPDFVFPNGFIEHFQVSLANETKKGSEHNIAVKDFEEISSEVFEKEQYDFLQSPPRKNASADKYDMQVITHKMESPDYSYNNFVCSFKRNFEKHINSLQRYSGEKSVGIFLIELVGARIRIMKNGAFRSFYRLAVDREMLEYINGYSEYLKYIVFANSEGYELLDIENIPTLLQNIPTGLTFGVGRYIKTNHILFIDF